MIYLYGASGHGKVVMDILNANKVSVGGWIDDNPQFTVYKGLQVNRSLEFFNPNPATDHVLITIGNNFFRKMVADKLKPKTEFATAIHQSVQMSKGVKVGEGTVMMANVTINIDAKIGNHCILNTSCSIDHDCTLMDFVHISPNVALAGDVNVGEGTHIGIGASVIQGITIGKWAIIGAGAVIIQDVPDYAVVVGVPGRIIKYNSRGQKNE